MPESPALSVVVPLYNEEGNIAELQREIDAALAGIDYELVLVDDGSTDATVLRVLQSERVRLLEFEKMRARVPPCMLEFLLPAPLSL